MTSLTLSDWAVEQGYADRDRVAIFGGSYGGYATLVGVTFTPDLFAAAIDYVGISSLVNFMRTLPATARPHLANNWHLFVGNPDDPEQEADMLARSPITKVDQIRAPLLVIQGANDSSRRTGRIRQSRRRSAGTWRRGRVHGQGRRRARFPQPRQPH